MSENIIYYGPPGTGKTYWLQGLLNDYIDYTISDHQIIDTYTRNSEDWLLITLVILQNQGGIKATDIQSKVSSLGLKRALNVSAILETHSVLPSPLGVARKQPRIFFEYVPGKWYVDRARLLQFDPHFFEHYLSNSSVDRRYSFVTFHQSFSYEDFIEGIRPTYDETTKAIDYSPKPGVFKLLCSEAAVHPEKQYAVFIDEINRGNISEIFGELISLIETDKRKGAASELSAILPYSKEVFVVPSNVNIYGTMNSADKSIAAIDIALRRRFKFIPILPDSEIIKSELEFVGVNAYDIEGVDLIKLFNTLNSRIELLLDANHLIGHSFFLKVRTALDIANVLKERIIPLLEEYFFDDAQKIQLVLNSLDSNGNLKKDAVYCHTELPVDKYFPFVGDYLLEDRKRYYVASNISVASLQQVYDGIS